MSCHRYSSFDLFGAITLAEFQSDILQLSEDHHFCLLDIYFQRTTRTLQAYDLELFHDLILLAVGRCATCQHIPDVRHPTA